MYQKLMSNNLLLPIDQSLFLLFYAKLVSLEDAQQLGQSDYERVKSGF